MSSVAEALLKERDAAYAERDLHIRAGELMAQEIEKLRNALEFYSCKDGCNDCPANERDRVGCGWTARVALTEVTPKGNPE